MCKTEYLCTRSEVTDLNLSFEEKTIKVDKQLGSMIQRDGTSTR